MRPALVILTTHFGTNFSGGSTATCEILSRLEDEFSAIHVVANEVGEHPFQNLTWHRYRTTPGAMLTLRRLARSNPVIYADFYNAYWLSILGLPYYFTYHDNWPELGDLSLHFRLQQLFYWPVYRWIFRTAQHVIVVSERKRQLLKRWCQRLTLIRNGCQQPVQSSATRKRINVLMVGNIDARKYAKALELFDTLPNDPGFTIDIYGHSSQPLLARQLERIPFVSLKGFHTHIPYSRYQLLLHTSIMENLSIVWCEALLHKTPVLTFNVGAADEVITDSSGVRITSYDIPAMRAALISLMHSPINLETAPDHLVEFNWDIAALHYRDILLASADSQLPRTSTCRRENS